MAELHLRQDRLWGAACLGYSVQAVFDEDSLGRLAERQAALVEDCTVNFHCTPQASMHVSVFPLVPARWVGDGKAALWDRLRAPAIREFAAARWPGDFTLELDEVEVTRTAVILFTRAQPEPIGGLRERLNDLVAAAGLERLRFDRTHVTLARPARDQRLTSAVVADLGARVNGLTVRIQALRLVRELVYPSLEVEVIA